MKKNSQSYSSRDHRSKDAKPSKSKEPSSKLSKNNLSRDTSEKQLTEVRRPKRSDHLQSSERRFGTQNSSQKRHYVSQNKDLKEVSEPKQPSQAKPTETDNIDIIDQSIQYLKHREAQKKKVEEEKTSDPAHVSPISRIISPQTTSQSQMKGVTKENSELMEKKQAAFRKQLEEFKKLMNDAKSSLHSQASLRIDDEGKSDSLNLGGDLGSTSQYNNLQQIQDDSSQKDPLAKTMNFDLLGGRLDKSGRMSCLNPHDAVSISSLNTVQAQEENEKQLQKYEADIRQHISIEQQLQIYIDSLNQKIEDMEKYQSEIEATNKFLMEESEKAEDRLTESEELFKQASEKKEASLKEAEAKLKAVEDQLKAAQLKSDEESAKLKKFEEQNLTLKNDNTALQNEKENLQKTLGEVQIVNDAQMKKISSLELENEELKKSNKELQLAKERMKAINNVVTHNTQASSGVPQQQHPNTARVRDHPQYKYAQNHLSGIITPNPMTTLEFKNNSTSHVMQTRNMSHFKGSGGNDFGISQRVSNQDIHSIEGRLRDISPQSAVLHRSLGRQSNEIVDLGVSFQKKMDSAKKGNKFSAYTKSQTQLQNSLNSLQNLQKIQYAQQQAKNVQQNIPIKRKAKKNTTQSLDISASNEVSKRSLQVIGAQDRAMREKSSGPQNLSVAFVQQPAMYNVKHPSQSALKIKNSVLNKSEARISGSVQAATRATKMISDPAMSKTIDHTKKAFKQIQSQGTYFPEVSMLHKKQENLDKTIDASGLTARGPLEPGHLASSSLCVIKDDPLDQVSHARSQDPITARATRQPSKSREATSTDQQRALSERDGKLASSQALSSSQLAKGVPLNQLYPAAPTAEEVTPVLDLTKPVEAKGNGHNPFNLSEVQKREFKETLNQKLNSIEAAVQHQNGRLRAKKPSTADQQKSLSKKFIQKSTHHLKKNSQINPSSASATRLKTYSRHSQSQSQLVRVQGFNKDAGSSNVIRAQNIKTLNLIGATGGKRTAVKDTGPHHATLDLLNTQEQVPQLETEIFPTSTQVYPVDNEPEEEKKDEVVIPMEQVMLNDKTVAVRLPSSSPSSGKQVAQSSHRNSKSLATNPQVNPYGNSGHHKGPSYSQLSFRAGDRQGTAMQSSSRLSSNSNQHKAGGSQTFRMRNGSSQASGFLHSTSKPNPYGGVSAQRNSALGQSRQLEVKSIQAYSYRQGLASKKGSIAGEVKQQSSKKKVVGEATTTTGLTSGKHTSTVHRRAKTNLGMSSLKPKP